jgi:peptidoglycan/LPS O-acetylase OafA/YrhL
MKKTLHSIQELRGIAAILVVVLHASLAVQMRGWNIHIGQFFQAWPALGVDLFFVISGVIMMVTTADRRPGWRTALAFLRGRLVRIVPIYWIFTTVMLVLLAALPTMFYKNRLDVLHAVCSYLFFPATNAYTGSTRPLLPPGWTLVYEMWFYLVFAALLLLPRRCTFPIVAGFFTLTSVLGLVVHDGFAFGVYTSPLMLEFVFGCLIGKLFCSRIQVSRRTAAITLSLGIVLLLGTTSLQIGPTERFFYWGVPAALVVGGALFWERAGGWQPHRLLGAIGDRSYSLYLSHYLLLLALMAVASKIDRGHQLPGDAVWLVFILSAIVIGALSYRFIETPIANWFKRGRGALSNAPVTAPPVNAQ